MSDEEKQTPTIFTQPIFKPVPADFALAPNNIVMRLEPSRVSIVALGLPCDSRLVEFGVHSPVPLPFVEHGEAQLRRVQRHLHIEAHHVVSHRPVLPGDNHFLGGNTGEVDVELDDLLHG